MALTNLPDKSLFWTESLLGNISSFCSETNLLSHEIENEAAEHNLLLQQYHLKVMDLQQVLVIQPWYDHNLPMSKTEDTTEDLAMAETLGLVKTLSWSVVDALILNVRGPDRNYFFGTGQLDRLKELVGEILSRPIYVLFEFTSVSRPMYKVFVSVSILFT